MCQYINLNPLTSISAHILIFNAGIFWACLKPGSRFTMSYVVVCFFFLLYPQCIEVRCDIGGIVDHHCLTKRLEIPKGQPEAMNRITDNTLHWPNNDLQNTTQKTKYRATRTLLNTWAVDWTPHMLMLTLLTNITSARIFMLTHIQSGINSYDYSSKKQHQC